MVRAVVFAALILCPAMASAADGSGWSVPTLKGGDGPIVVPPKTAYVDPSLPRATTVIIPGRGMDMSAIARIGYRGVEITVIPGYTTALELLGAAERRRIRGLLAEHRLELPAIAAHRSLLAEEPEAHALAARMPALLIEAQRVAHTVTHGSHGRRRAGPGETFWQFRHFDYNDSRAGIDWRRAQRTDWDDSLALAAGFSAQNNGRFARFLFRYFTGAALLEQFFLTPEKYWSVELSFWF